MNKIMKKIALACVCGILAGLLFVGIGFAAGGRLFAVDSHGKVYTEKEKKTAFVSKECKVKPFADVDVNVSEADVIVKKGDSYKVSYTLPKEEKVSVAVKNKKLEIKNVKNRGFHKTGVHAFMIDFLPVSEKKQENAQIIITIPKQKLNALLITSGYGDVKMQELTARQVDLNLEYGDLKAQDFNLEKGQIKMEDGDAILNRVELGKTSLDLEYGDVSIEHMKASQVQMKLEDGDATIKDMKLEKLLAQFSYGDCTLESGTFQNIEVSNEDGDSKLQDITTRTLDVTGEDGDLKVKDSTVEKLTAKLSSGDVDLLLKGQKKAYALELVTDSGDVSVDHKGDKSHVLQSGSKNKKIAVQTDDGDVNLQFDE